MLFYPHKKINILLQLNLQIKLRLLVPMQNLNLKS